MENISTGKTTNFILDVQHTLDTHVDEGQIMLIFKSKSTKNFNLNITFLCILFSFVFFITTLVFKILVLRLPHLYYSVNLFLKLLFKNYRLK